jgi:hypothetical protein
MCTHFFARVSAFYEILKVCRSTVLTTQLVPARNIPAQLLFLTRICLLSHSPTQQRRLN